MKAFRHKNFAGIQAFGWQADVRFDGWLPFSVRYGYKPRDTAFRYVWRIPLLGWAVTVGKLRAPEPRFDVKLEQLRLKVLHAQQKRDEWYAANPRPTLLQAWDVDVELASAQDTLARYQSRGPQ